MTRTLVGCLAVGGIALAAPALALGERQLNPPTDATPPCSAVLDIYAEMDERYVELKTPGESCFAPIRTTNVLNGGFWERGPFPTYITREPLVLGLRGPTGKWNSPWNLFGGSDFNGGQPNEDKWNVCGILNPEAPAYCSSDQAPVESTTLYVVTETEAVVSSWPAQRFAVTLGERGGWGHYVTKVASAEAGSYTLMIGSDQAKYPIANLRVMRSFGESDVEPAPPGTPDAILPDDPTMISNDQTPAPVTRDKPVYFSIPATDNGKSARGACEWRGKKVACVTETSPVAGFTGTYTLKANLSGTKKKMKGACQWTDTNPQCRVWLTEKGSWRLTWGAGEKSFARTVVVK